MKSHRQYYDRQSLRLKGFDYSRDGAYFLTLVVQDRLCLFGEVANQEMRLNAAGHMILRWWKKLPEKFPSVRLDTLVVMPDHLHGLIVIDRRKLDATGQTHGSAPTPRSTLTLTASIADLHRPVGADPRVRPAESSARPNAPLGQTVQWFKTMTTNEYIRAVRELGWEAFMGRLWQRNYYEHVVRSPQDYARIQRYILSNPTRWVNEDEK